MFRIEANIFYDEKENCYRIRSKVYLKEKSFCIEGRYMPMDEGIFDIAWKDIGNYLKDAMKEESYV